MLLSCQQRLKAIQNSRIDDVGLALDLASLVKFKPKYDVACFLVPVNERPAANRRTAGPALQEVQITIGVVIAIRSLNDRKGNRSVDELEEVREQVRKALFGWTPEKASASFVLGNSDLVKMETGSIWWMDRYICKTQHKQKVTSRG